MFAKLIQTSFFSKIYLSEFVVLWYLKLFVCFPLKFVWSTPIKLCRGYSPIPSVCCVPLNPRLGWAFVFLSSSRSVHCERGLCMVSDFLVCKPLS